MTIRILLIYWSDEESWFISRQGLKHSSLHHDAQSSPRVHRLCYSTDIRVPLPRKKRPVIESVHLSPSSFKVKNWRTYIYIPPYALMACPGTHWRLHVYSEPKPEVSEQQSLNYMKRNCGRDAQQYDQHPRKSIGTNCVEKILNSAENLTQRNKFFASCGLWSLTVAFIRTSYWTLWSILSFTSSVFKVISK